MSGFTSKYCHNHNYDVRKSDITGRRVVRNLSQDKFLILEKYDANVARDLAIEFVDLLNEWSRKVTGANKSPVPLKVRTQLNQVDDFNDPANLAAWIDAALQVKSKNGYPAFVKHFMIKLWVKGCVLWPASDQNIFDPRIRWTFNPGPNEFGDVEPIISAAHTILRGTEKNKNASLRKLIRVVLSCSKIEESGDLSPSVIDAEYIQNFVEPKPKTLNRCIQTLIEIQKARHGADVVKFGTDSFLGRKKSLVEDEEFMWIRNGDPNMESWRKAITTWFANSTRAREAKHTSVRRFMKYLRQLPEGPRSPEVYVSSRTPPSQSFADFCSTLNLGSETKKRTQNIISDLFDYYIMLNHTDENDDGDPVVVPGIKNHVLKSVKIVGDNSSETYRTPLPTRLVRQLIQVIEEDDFAWPKTLKEDYVTKAGASYEYDEWCPVRAIAVLIKLMLPLRTSQVRWLDSGEADSTVYQPELGGWIQNKSHLISPVNGEVRRGVLRQFWDKSSGDNRTGFYINTNKTADVGKDEHSKGYEIPWEYTRVIDLVTYLRDWQSQHNPLSKPLPWSEVVDTMYTRSRNPENLLAAGSVCFLFRDPCSKQRSADQTISNARLETFWALLLQELERRCQDSGMEMVNGEPITLITDVGRGKLKPEYTLHDLRVTIISSLAEQGVPIAVLSKVVAGHATVIMTLYYTKLGIDHVSEVLSEAQQKAEADEQKNWTKFLASAAREEIRNHIAFNDGSALDAVTKSRPGSWVPMDEGLCPVGCSKCHVGGKCINATFEGKDKGHAPVRGGSQNCVSCRFFLTGPAFTIGLMAKFNAYGYELKEASARYRSLENELEALEEDRYASELSGAPWTDDHRIQKVENDIQAAAIKVDDLAMNWHDANNLIQSCLKLLKEDPSDDNSGASLVISGGEKDLEIAFEETTDFALADAVCQTSTFYKSIDSTVPSLRRAKVIDAMLMNNHRNPVFATLTDEQALRVGNEMTRFLMKRIGKHDTLALMEGQSTLDQLGLNEEFDSELRALTGVQTQTLQRQETIQSLSAPVQGEK